MKHPDLNLLLALDALLEEGCVAGAARRMAFELACDEPYPRNPGDPIFVQAGRKLVPTPRALALREQIRAAVQQATEVLAPAADAVDLKTLERCLDVRATDVFQSIHLGHLLDEMPTDMPIAMLRLSPKEDDLDDEALRSGRIDLFVSASRHHYEPAAAQ